MNKMYEKLSREGLTTIINNINNAVFIHRADGKILYINDIALHMYGIKREEVKELSIIDDLSGPMAPIENVHAIWDNLIKSPDNNRTEIGWEAKRPHDGTTFSVTVQAMKIKFKDENCVLALVSDTSKEKRHECQLREWEDRYKNAIECSNDGVAMISGNKFLLINRKFAEIFGYDSQEDLIRRTYQSTVHPDDLPIVQGNYKRLQNGDQAQTKYEFRGIKKNGDVIDLEASISHMDYNGAPVLLAYIRDITEIKQYYGLVRTQRDLAMELARAKSARDAMIKALNIIAGASQMDSGGIYLFGKSGDLELACSFGLNDEFVQAVRVVKKDSAEMEKIKLYGKLDSILCYVPPEKTIFLEATEKEGLTMIGCAPIIYENQIKGIISIASHTKRFASENIVVNVLHTAAAQLSVVLSRFEVESKLKRSEKLVRRILDNAMFGMFRTKLDGTIVDSNLALAKIHGYDSEAEYLHAISGNAANTYADPSDWQLFVDKLQAKGSVVMHEAKTRHKNGSEMWVKLSARLVMEDGVNYIEGMFEDITEHKLAENKLESQLQLLNSVLDGVPDIIGIQNPDHTIVRYNKAGYDALGMVHEDVVGKKCYELIGRHVPCDPCPTAKALVSKKIEQMEKYFPELGRYMFCCNSPVLDKNGEVCLIVEQLQDVTGRVHAEADIIRRSEAMEAATDGIAITDDNETYIYGDILSPMNKGASKCL